MYSSLIFFFRLACRPSILGIGTIDISISRFDDTLAQVDLRMLIAIPFVDLGHFALLGSSPASLPLLFT